MESQTATFPLPTPSSNQTRITILGAGIVGSALAFYLSARSPASQIILLDPSPASHAGSTAIAPGLVGQLNTIPHLTAIAKESVEAYLKVPRAFQKVGGLEIASSKEGIQELKKRREVAMESGLEAEILSSKEVSELAPDFHAEDEESIGLYFAGDGTADPPLIARHYQDQVKAHGASIVATKVSAIVVGKDGKLSLATDHGALETDELIVAAGIWTAFLLQTLGINLPIVPVAHPYAYGPVRPRREKQQPFVRWPERHVYACDHGDCDGFGTYDHEPVPCVPGENALFEQGLDPNILASTLSAFPHSQQRETKVPYKHINGIFALTPDSMPIAGPVSKIPGLYIAAAVWTTHAAGVGRLMADIVSGKELSVEDEVLRRAFDPLRYEGLDASSLRERALGTYNDIYNKDRH